MERVHRMWDSEGGGGVTQRPMVEARATMTRAMISATVQFLSARCRGVEVRENLK